MIKRLIYTILLNTAILFFVHYILGDDTFSITPSWGFAAVGAVLGILNFIVKPILSLLALPFMLMTFGLFLSVINIFILYLLVFIFENILTIGVEISILGGWTTYLIVSILISVLNALFHLFIRVK